MNTFIDITGHRFGRLTAIRYDKKSRSWQCSCECGNVCMARSADLRSGKIKSCKCYMLEVSAANGRKRRIHGARFTRAWIVWFGMKQRCFYKKHKAYPRYGAVGITVCERWMTFENFLADMGQPPPGHTLDRFPNKSGNYEPGNCRWATAQQQARNQKSNRLITAFGETKLLCEWVEDYRCLVTKDALGHRLSAGWEVEDAISRPPRKQVNSRVFVGGESTKAGGSHA